MRATLFSRSRSGCAPTKLCERLIRHGERIEAKLQAAQLTTSSDESSLEGRVRITSTDVLLHGPVVPCLAELRLAHLKLRFELVATYDLANLSKRDADIALRATINPPKHLVGRSLGKMKEAVFAKAQHAGTSRGTDLAAPWVVLDDSVASHPSSLWRKQHQRGIDAVLTANSIESVFDAIAAGLGVGVLPLFMTIHRPDLVQLTPDLKECESELWLLSHPDARHLRSVSTVSSFFANASRLP